jgi:hypothetical protein
MRTYLLTFFAVLAIAAALAWHATRPVTAQLQSAVSDGDPNWTPETNRLILVKTSLASAIARLEGWGDPNSFTHRIHNPGALTFANQSGAHHLGTTMYAWFESDEEGWQALTRDIEAKWKRIDTGDDLYTAGRIAMMWPEGPREHQWDYSDKIMSILEGK